MLLRRSREPADSLHCTLTCSNMSFTMYRSDGTERERKKQGIMANVDSTANVAISKLEARVLLSTASCRSRKTLSRASATRCG